MNSLANSNTQTRTRPAIVAIEGNIGAGKTTLTRLLAKNYGWTPQYEDVENNPYLNDFYENNDCNLQIFSWWKLI